MTSVTASDYRGQCVVVTGGGHGIGRALAEAFAGEGAHVVVADRHGPRAEKVAHHINGVAVPGDVASPQAIGALVERAVAAFGPVRVFCSNAGITGGFGLESTPEEIDEITRINLLAHVGPPKPSYRACSRRVVVTWCRHCRRPPLSAGPPPWATRSPNTEHSDSPSGRS